MLFFISLFIDKSYPNEVNTIISKGYEKTKIIRYFFKKKNSKNVLKHKMLQNLIVNCLEPMCCLASSSTNLYIFLLIFINLFLIYNHSFLSLSLNMARL